MALGRYNLDGYNLLSGNDLRHTEVYEMYSTTVAAFATSPAVSPMYFCSQGTVSFMAIGYGYDVDYTLEQNLQSSQTLGFFISPPYKMGETLSVSAAQSLNISPGYMCSQAMTAQVTANFAVYVRQSMGAELSAVTSYDIAHYPVYGMLQALDARVDMVPIIVTVMNFNDIVIPPGGMLVIDAENCTAYLDNDNVIDLYSGDWMWFTKQLQGIDVTSNTSGDIDVKILYRERYL